MSTPSLQLPLMPVAWHQAVDLFALDWYALPHLPQFVLANGRSLARQQTVVRICANQQALAVHFFCHDKDIWATMSQRDEPIYDEEVVELFLSPGSKTPIDYFEFEINPDGVLFDARIHNPGERERIVVDSEWNCPGIRWQAVRRDDENEWEAAIYLPWMGLLGHATLPSIWRANFYRIERPRDEEPEFSCWSPTLTEPADFYIPERFGSLII